MTGLKQVQELQDGRKQRSYYISIGAAYITELKAKNKKETQCYV